MYKVDGMTLIPQNKTMACWYASAQMVIKWRQDKLQMSEINLIDPKWDAECQKIMEANGGITNPQLMEMAGRLGLESVPPMSPTPAAIDKWLRQYGPLWVNGKRHIVVISGIDGDLSSPTPFNIKVRIHDPAPVDIGKIDWRSLSQLYTGTTNETFDYSDSVRAVFLHCPRLPDWATVTLPKASKLQKGDWVGPDLPSGQRYA